MSGHTTLPSPPYTSTPLVTLLFHHHPTQVHHWPHYSSITTLHKYTTGHTTLPSPPYTSTPLTTLLFHHHPTQVHHWPHHHPTQVHHWPRPLHHHLHKYTTGPITTLHKYTTGHTTLPSPPYTSTLLATPPPSPPYTSTPLATLLFHHHPTQVHHWPHYSSITTLHKYTTGHTTLPSPPYTSTPLAPSPPYTSTPLATPPPSPPTQVHHWPHHHPTQVHHWPHYSSITTLHKYTTGHTTLSSPPYTSTLLATPPPSPPYTSTPLATLLFHHHPTQVHHWPQYSSITTLLQIELYNSPIKCHTLQGHVNPMTPLR